MAKITPVKNVNASGDQGVDGILNGTAWATSSLTYSFPDTSADYGPQQAYGNPNPYNNLTKLNPQQQADVTRALGLISGYTGLGFTLIQDTPTVNAALRYANSSYPPTSYSYYPGGTSGGDTFFGSTGKAPVQGNFDSGQTILHETGHAFGLKHGQDTSGFGAVPANLLDIEYSVMDYPNYIGSTESYSTAGPGSSPQGYMQCDIAALQYMYGENLSNAGTKLTYTWSPTDGEEFINGVSQGTPYDNHVFGTVWTAGATATYDFMNYSASGSYDLRPGGAVDFSPFQLADLGYSGNQGPGVNFARGNVYNALLYRGDTSTEVSALLTGNGNDAVYLNDVYDTVTLGSGHDTVFAGRGGGYISGTGASDTLALPGNRAEYTLTPLSQTSLRVTDSATSRTGTETLQGIRYLSFADGTVDGNTIMPVQPPYLVQQTGDFRVAESVRFSFSIPVDTFSDPQGGTISYSAASENGAPLPSWLSFDAATRTFSGTAPGAVGMIAVRVDGVAPDGKGAAEAFHVYTTPGSPALLAQAGDQRLGGNLGFTFALPQPSFSDPSSGPLTLAASQVEGSALPPWVSFDPARGVFSGTTPSGGATLGIRVDATTPEGVSAAEAFHLYVDPLPPAFAQQTPDASFDYGSAFSFAIPAQTFTDPGGGTLAYSAKQPGDAALPSWIAFDPATFKFSGTVPTSIPGTSPEATAVQAIEVDATDRQGLVSGEAFHLYLTPQPPSFHVQTDDQRLSTATPFSFAISPGTFTDPEGGAITYSAFQTSGAALPGWISFSATADRFSGITQSTPGVLAIEVLATAISGRQAAEAFHIYTG